MSKPNETTLHCPRCAYRTEVTRTESVRHSLALATGHGIALCCPACELPLVVVPGPTEESEP